MPNNEVGVSGQFKAGISEIQGLSPLKVTDFVNFSPGTTPGNVGICLSGGGSRAMTAGMGQLRGLKNLKNSNGSLLEQTKAIATASGGSWVGVTFAYLNSAHCSDDDYLGTYRSPSQVTPSDLSNLNPNNIGFRCTKNFGLLSLLWQAIKLRILKVPANMLWQTLIGNNILSYYDLFDVSRSYTPNSLFSYDPDTLKKDITALNPSLSEEKAYLIASGPSRERRPYLICNMGMFVKTPGTDFEYLVPAQATPFFTGIISTPPNVTDFNDKPVGGGTVTSFTFSSNLESIDAHNEVTVNQSRQFALADAVGVSSAFFAEILENLAAQYLATPEEFIKDLIAHGQEMNESINTALNLAPGEKDALDILVEKVSKLNPLEIVKDDLEKILSRVGIDLEEDVKKLLADITGLVPQYKYWPVLNIAKNTDVKPTKFADAGNLENTGINGMLAYSDIDNIIAFINTVTPLGSAKHGVIDPETHQEIPGTQIMVDSQIPPLFGYQPYNDSCGYQIYDNGPNGSCKASNSEFRYNQVFPSTSFVELLKGLWENCEKKTYFGSNFIQSLTTVDNIWFGVKGERKVKVIWVYNGNFKGWYENLTPEAQGVVSEISNFPYYNTITETELSNEQVNALGSVASWNIVEGIKDTILEMYK
ncbi:MAG: hypothetical protein ACM3SY_01465 [Candidatus Omnitrophota bacterium]